MRLGNLTFPDMGNIEKRLAQIFRSERYRPDWRFRNESIGPVELQVGGSAKLFAPRPGFVWDLRRLTVSGIGTLTEIELYLNDTNPASLVAVLNGGLNQFEPGAIITYPGNELWVRNSTGGLIEIYANACAREAPVSCEWSF